MSVLESKLIKFISQERNLKNKGFVCILPVKHHLLRLSGKFFVDSALQNCHECHSRQRHSILTNTLFKLDKLYEKFASYRLAVAKINRRQAGTGSDVFSLQQKAGPY